MTRLAVCRKDRERHCRTRSTGKTVHSDDTSAPARTDDPGPGGTALLIVDMISDWTFPDAESLLVEATPIAPRIQALKARCKAAGVPVIYANDNHGRWRSDFRQVVASCLARGGAPADIGRRLAPEENDFFVLKPSQSAFFSTPLALLLQHLQVRRLLICGVAGDQCVLVTAAEALLRKYAVAIPGDCVASLSSERHARSLRHFEETLGVDTRLHTEQPILPKEDGGSSIDAGRTGAH